MSSYDPDFEDDVREEYRRDEYADKVFEYYGPCDYMTEDKHCVLHAQHVQPHVMMFKIVEGEQRDLTDEEYMLDLVDNIYYFTHDEVDPDETVKNCRLLIEHLTKGDPA